MIRGIHGMFYTAQAEELRAFLRDKLGLPHTDVGGGWLVFDLPEADLGVHPVEDVANSGTHDISFYCDDLAGTVAELRSRGVEFEGDISHQGWGSSITFTMPGEVRVQLYEPRYQKKKAKPAARAARKSVARPAAAKSARRKPAPRAKRAKAPAAKAAAKKKSTKRRR